MKTFITIILLMFAVSEAAAQAGCETGLNNAIPPAPYEDGYMVFDGTGDFLRTNDINGLEFPPNQTDSFTISARFKITKPYSVMYILGKKRTAGWAIGYHTAEYGYVSILFNNEWKRVYDLGADTNWHKYEIVYSRAQQKLTAIVDGNVTAVHNNFTYSSLSDNSAFSIGNVGFLPQYGPFSVNLTSYWFKGAIASVKVNSNALCIVDYSFNEGGGQVARDSSSYFYSDRTLPGSTTCGASHLMVGYMPSEDTCDPVWSAFDTPVESNFSPLGTGMQYMYTGPYGTYSADHFSLAMTVWNGQLINAGYFNIAGGVNANHIASWDGEAWSPLGAGLNHEAQSVCSYNGELYAAGFFDSAGTRPASYIAKWDGAEWDAVGGGIDNIGNVMTTFRGDLVVGGWFTQAGGQNALSIARWDGSAWHSMKIGMNGPVYALCEYNGELYAGGNFHFAGNEICKGIAKWDGYKWYPVGTGVAGGEAGVYTLEVYNGELYAGGSFITMNGVTVYNIAKYNGSVWSSVGSGATGANCNSSQGIVNSLRVCRGELYAAGMFTKMNGTTANKLAKYNSYTWCPVEYGVDLKPRAMVVYEDELIINGDFYGASGVQSSNIVKYTPKTVITGNNGTTETAKEFSLGQNYPNPFNPATVIKYSVAKNSTAVKLAVYDVTGKMVAELVNKQVNQGSYEVKFEASALASGIYIYRIEARDKDGVTFTESRKMALIK
ncbi:MAG: T9SS type A sorting domain-containing protein [Ignavibacteria bacterium]|nr:T9SS type A sorting domain-containing protein [Ignavibacteria bacterium]